jgi:tRNA(fMet)-specific endonuclease VapC
MSVYILDTGILVGYIRAAGYAEYIEEKYSVSQPPNIAIISVVTVGEMLSLALQLGWAKRKREAMKSLLGIFPSIGISDDRIIGRYAEIDAFSQGKHPLKNLPEGMTSRNMGKNDIWIRHYWK